MCVFLALVFVLFPIPESLDHPEFPERFRERYQAVVGIEQVDVLNDMAVFALTQRFEGADRWIDEALKRSEALNYAKGKGVALASRALIQFREKSYDRAALSCEQAIEHLQSGPHYLPLGLAYRRLGHICAERFDYDQMQVNFQNAIKNYTISGDTFNLADTHNHFGLRLWHQGEYAKSIEHFDQALTLFEDQDLPAKQATVLNNLGVVYYNWGRYEDALKAYYASLDIRHRLDQVEASINVLGNIGKTLMDYGQDEGALMRFEEALELARSEDLDGPTAYALNNLGEFYLARDQVDRAIEAMRESLGLYTSLQRNGGMILNHNGLGRAHLKQGSHDDAKTHFERALELAQKNDMPVREAEALRHLGEWYLEQGQLTKSGRVLEQSRQIAERIQQKKLLAEIYGHMAEVHRRSGAYEKAFLAYEKSVGLKDALYNVQVAGKLAEVQERYYTLAKEKENLSLKAERQAQEILLKRQSERLMQISAVSILLLLLLGIVARSYFVKRRLNQVMAESHATITQQKRDLELKNTELESALKEVRTLSGLLPICSNCKKIRNDSGYWEQLESYFKRHSDTQFSHSICPDCIPEFFPDSLKRKLEEQREQRAEQD